MPLRLKADQQHGGALVPQPALEMMPDAAGVAHAAGRDDDVEAGQLGDRLAFVDRLGEAQMRRAEQAVDVDLAVEARGMFAEHLGGVNRQRRIEEDRRRRHFAALHQVDQIDDQFLGALDREGRNEQRALCAAASRTSAARRCAALLAASLLGGSGRHRSIPKSRSRIPPAPSGSGCEQLGVGADIAGGEQAQRLAG